MNWKRVALGVLALVVLTTLGHDWSKPAHAATNRGWIGGTSGLWGIASNWSPAGVPQDGDVLIFHSAANGGATSITISAPQGNTTRIASITSDIRYLTIAGPVTITKSIFVETILDQVNIGSLYLDGDETELSMQSSRSVRGSIQVADQLRIRGSVNDHGGLVYAEHLVGSGSVVAKTGTFSARDTSDFDGTLSAVLSGVLAFPTPAFQTTCDRAGTRVVLDPSARLEFESSCTNVLASLEGYGTVGQIPTTTGVLQLKLVDAQGLFYGKIEKGAPLALECCGTGQLLLAGEQFNITQIDLTGGRLTTVGLDLSADAFVNVLGGSAFGGTSILGNVAINDGSLAMSGGRGVFNSLLFTSSGHAHFRISGPDSSSLSQAATNGVLDLGSASLQGTAGNLSVEFANGYVPPVGLPLPIITGASDVQGAFKSLPEGAVGNLGGFPFKITYKGGTSGHDVVITRQASPGTPTPTTTPTGGSLANRRVLPGVAKDGQ